MPPCNIRKELAEAAQETLRQITKLTDEEIECIRKRDSARLLAVDKELELLFGEKERRFGALNQHTAEHGC